MYQENQYNTYSVEAAYPPDYLIFSILNILLFTPLFVFWIPALILSIIVRQRSHDVECSEKLSNLSWGLNMACSILGAFYL
jgi:hypothetical protein